MCSRYPSAPELSCPCPPWLIDQRPMMIQTQALKHARNGPVPCEESSSPGRPLSTSPHYSIRAFQHSSEIEIDGILICVLPFVHPIAADCTPLQPRPRSLLIFLIVPGIS